MDSGVLEEAAGLRLDALDEHRYCAAGDAADRGRLQIVAIVAIAICRAATWNDRPA
jgi:hypothetical protein